MILFDKNKSTRKQCLSEKNIWKYCLSLIFRANITTHVKKMHGASYNCEQCNRNLKKVTENNININ